MDHTNSNYVSSERLLGSGSENAEPPPSLKGVASGSSPPGASSFNSLKSFNGRAYSGMSIGSEHNWNYVNATWREQKLTPDKWAIRFEALKKRITPAPTNTGALVRTRYNWFIVADQKAIKKDKDTYQTLLEGFKFKVGHMRPHWRTWSYNYKEQLSYKERVIQILEQTLSELKGSQ